MYWAVVVTKPNSEAIAEDNLRRQGFTFFCPRFEERRPNKPTRIRPLFPRYMFVLVDQAWWCIKNTYGVSSLLMDGASPEPLPELIIERLKRRLNSKGLIGLEVKPKFAMGAPVKTSKGPFAGHMLLYDGMTGHERVRVLLEAMGGKVSVELPEADLAAA